MRSRYLTFRRAATAEFEEKKSKFIAAASPVRCEREAVEFLAAVRARHRMATHNVFAYIAPADCEGPTAPSGMAPSGMAPSGMSPSGMPPSGMPPPQPPTAPAPAGGAVATKRQSDDGEPSGTAGMPVLEVLEKNGIEDAIIVVTRYFGGTLLGAAGLVRAYGKAATLAVASAGVARMELADEIRILAGYAHYGALMSEIAKSGLQDPAATFEADVEIRVRTPKQQTAGFIARVADITSGAAIAELCGESYIMA